MEEPTPEFTPKVTPDATVETVTSPPWNRATRRTVALVIAALLLFILWRFQGLIAQIVFAALLAYLLNPVIDFLAGQTRFRRGTVTLIVYLLVVLLLLGALAMVGVAVYNQVSDLIATLPDLIDQAIGFIGDLTNNPNRVIAIGPYELRLGDIDWASLDDQLLGLINPAVTAGPAAAGQVAQSTFNVLGWVTMTLILSLYIALDLPRTGRDLNHVMLQSGYYADYVRLKTELVKIGNAYLRGQAILGLVVGTLTGVLLAVLGVRNALALGIVSGLLEMIPYFGPLISAVVAILVAFFQPENYLGLTQFQFALATMGVMILVQQIENNFLVPRVVGGALDLKPLTVIIAVLVFGALAGIWGIILAAPIAAMIKLIGGYVWRKLLGLDPFPPEGQPAVRGSSLLGRSLGRIRGRSRRPIVEVEDEEGPPGDPPGAVKA